MRDSPGRRQQALRGIGCGVTTLRDGYGAWLHVGNVSRFARAASAEAVVRAVERALAE